MHAPDALSVRYIRQSRESGTKMITPCKRIGCIKYLQIGGTKSEYLQYHAGIARGTG